MKDNKLRLPEIGEHLRLTGTLVEIQDVTPPPPARQLDYVFEDVTARVELLANGHLIDTRGTFNDFCGSAEQSAIKEAQKVSAKYGDAVEVRVVRVSERYRARPTDHGHEDFYNKGRLKFERLPHGCGAGMPEPVETVVWSSKGGA